MPEQHVFEGGCLCGRVRFRASAEPEFPHLCSCGMCRRWSGAPTLAWVEFPLAAFEWTGEGGEPHFFRSSKKTQRGNCTECGSALCAIDEGYDRISITVGALDHPDQVVPDERHSFASARPDWWQPALKSD